MKPSLVAPLFAALTLACGGSSDIPDAPGADTGRPTSGGLRPGEAGTGHLAYIVAPRDQLEITNLTTGRVEYRSREEDGQVQRFFLSADGTTAVFHTAVSPCTRVSLPSGTTSSCTPEGIVAALPIGISNDGARIAFTGLRLSGGSAAGQAVGSILEGTTLTDVATGDTNSVLTGCGAISPNGDAVYTFGYDRSVSENPPLSLTRHTVGGASEVIFDVADGVTAFNIIDVILQLSEDGTRGLFACSDPAQSVPVERIAVCTVDLQTGAVVRYPNAVGSLSLDGSTVITVPFIGENFSVYPFGNSTPSSVVMPGREGNSPTLSPDASRIGFRIRTDDAFRVAATRPIGGGANVLVQRNGEGGAATAAGMRWSR
jgi:hypothetical protein